MLTRIASQHLGASPRLPRHESEKLKKSIRISTRVVLQDRTKTCVKVWEIKQIADMQLVLILYCFDTQYASQMRLKRKKKAAEHGVTLRSRGLSAYSLLSFNSMRIFVRCRPNCRPAGRRRNRRRSRRAAAPDRLRIPSQSRRSSRGEPSRPLAPWRGPHAGGPRVRDVAPAGPGRRLSWRLAPPTFPASFLNHRLVTRRAAHPDRRRALRAKRIPSQR
jgi:hypothetical protein